MRSVLLRRFDRLIVILIVANLGRNPFRPFTSSKAIVLLVVNRCQSLSSCSILEYSLENIMKIGKERIIIYLFESNYTDMFYVLQAPIYS